MSHDPSLDLLNYLDVNSTRLTSAINLFRGPVRGPTIDSLMPTEAVFVVDTNGRAPERTLGPGIEVRHSGIQIRIRSTGYTNGFGLARHVYDVVQSASLSTGSAYMDVQCLQSGPAYMEQDKNMHHHWSLNLRMVHNST